MAQDKSFKPTELDSKTRDRLIENDLRSFKNRGFHDGYDDGRKSVAQDAFDAGYKKAFEQSFILSTLKGVAQTLKTSYNLKTKNRPTSTTISCSSSPSSRLRDDSGSDCSINLNSSSNSNNTTGGSNMTIDIPENHLNLLESMKFDNASDIESIKSDLIKICRENRLEILAHYVSQIG